MTRPFRILALHYSAAGWPFTRWHAEGLKRLGHEVLDFEIPQSWDEWRALLTSFKPDFAISEWMRIFDEPTGMEALESFLVEYKLPIFFIYFDHPLMWGRPHIVKRWLHGNHYPYGHFLMIEDSHTQFARATGADASTFVPAVDPQLFERIPERRSELAHPSAFCGWFGETNSHAPLTETYYLSVAANVAERRLSALVSTSEVSEILKGLQNLRPLFQELSLHPLAVREKFRHFDSLLSSGLQEALWQSALHAYSLKKLHELIQKASERLKDFVIYGDEQWNHLIPRDQVKAGLISRETLHSLYASAQTILHATKLQFLTKISERALTTWACGGFPILDRRLDLMSEFPEDTLCLYDSIDEAIEKINFFAAREAIRRKMTDKARAIVKEKHTTTARWKQFLKTIDLPYSEKGNAK